MSSTRSTGAGFLVVAVLYLSSSSASKITPASGEVVQDEYLVALKTGLTTNIIDRVAQYVSFNGGHIQQRYVIGKTTIFRVRGSMTIMEKLSLDDAVRVIQPNELVPMDEPVEDSDASSTQMKTNKSGSVQTEPCNEDFGGLDSWGIIRTSHNTMPNFDTDPYRWGSYKDDGTGVDIYILSSGIRTTHEDFQPDKAEWGFTSNGTAEREDPLTDLRGYGTIAAGTAAGNKYGIARNAHLIAVKISPGAWSDYIEGLEWVVKTVKEKQRQDNTARSVINIPLGNWAVTKAYPFEIAMQATVDAGIPVVTAAGNRGVDTCTHTPNRIASIITVGATEIDDTLATFSNYGPCTDILAPGSNIKGPSHNYDDQYALSTGTNRASALVVGIIARYLSVLPDSKVAKMTLELMKAKVVDSATRGAINWKYNRERAMPNRLIYKICEDGMDEEPTTTTISTNATKSTSSNTNPPTTVPPSTSTSGPMTILASWTMDDIHGLAVASLSLSTITLCGSFMSLTFLYLATRQNVTKK